MVLIDAKNISLSYEGVGNVVEDLSFCVEKGDYLCIVGENGSGKSTLVKALTGLMRTSSGHLHFLSGLTPSKIGYLPQASGSVRDFPASVYEVVMSGFAGKKGLLGFYSKNDKNTALSNMSLLGIAELKNKSFCSLSGGQQQRTLIARALCAKSEVLLLDEPVNNLDPKAKEETYSLLYHLNREHKITIIMVTHDIPASLKYSNKMLHLAGKPLYFGNTKDYTLYRQDLHTERGEKENA